MHLPAEIVFYDGKCRFCDAWVRFILDHDAKGVFHFSPRESDFAQAFLSKHAQDLKGVDSLVLYDEGQFLYYSDAAIGIASRLPGIWSFVRFGRYIPKSWRDALYRYVARNRYRWFGQRETCRMPSPGEAKRFHFDHPTVEEV